MTHSEEPLFKWIGAVREEAENSIRERAQVGRYTSEMFRPLKRSRSLSAARFHTWSGRNASFPACGHLRTSIIPRTRPSYIKYLDDAAPSSPRTPTDALKTFIIGRKNVYRGYRKA